LRSGWAEDWCDFDSRKERLQSGRQVLRQELRAFETYLYEALAKNFARCFGWPRRWGCSRRLRAPRKRGRQWSMAGLFFGLDRLWLFFEPNDFVR
jgi:hypothetical protein